MTHLKIGDKAPSYLGEDQNGKKHHLSDYNKQKLVVFFYPKASTPGCTAQACNLAENYEFLQKNGYQILGISADTAAAQNKFIDKNKLPFPLIADTEKEIIQSFGVWGPKKFMGKTYDGIHRTTFVIDENGIIIDIIEKVKTKEHSNQIIK